MCSKKHSHSLFFIYIMLLLIFKIWFSEFLNIFKSLRCFVPTRYLRVALRRFNLCFSNHNPLFICKLFSKYFYWTFWSAESKLNHHRMSAYKHIQDRIYYTYIVGTKCLKKKKKTKRCLWQMVDKNLCSISRLNIKVL